MTDTAGELAEAVRLAEGAFIEIGAEAAEHMLVGAQRLPGGSANCSGVRCWALVFKPRHLVPDSLDERETAGGEVRFTVDLDTGRAVFTGYGD